MPPIAQADPYCLIAFPYAPLDESLPMEVQVAPDTRAARSLPVEIPDHWKEWLGSTTVGDIMGCSLFLISTGPTTAGGASLPINHYGERLDHLFWGLYLTGRIASHDRLHRISGNGYQGLDSVKSYTQVEPLIDTPGIDLPRVSVARLQDANTVATQLRTVFADADKFDRLRRVVRTFCTASQARVAGDRLHQCIRCVEGMILPTAGRTKRQFKSRTELFIGPSHHALIGDLYDVRSAIEHLHGDLANVVGATDRDRALEIFRLTLQAEELARHCILRVLGNPDLWPHFETDATLAAFWALTPEQRQNAWGGPFDFAAVGQAFDPIRVPNDALTI